MTKYYVWLQQVLGYGSARLPAALSAFENPRAFYEANRGDIARSGLLTEDEMKKINKIPLDYADKILENCEKAGCRVLTPDKEEYPRRLFHTIDPPCALYVKGRMPEVDNEVAVSIVGARKPTADGVRAAASLAARLARAGVIIVSGGAYGIDRTAHLGALAADGISLCVMPCGINVNYPAGNKEMRREICENGCLISEFPPGTQVTTGAFHIRNRIVSALSLATAVVEAGEKSGTLITAHKAVDQGRDVFVMPGPIGVKQYAGSNQLISDGARPLLNAMDILGEYASAYPHKLNIRTAQDPFSKETLARLSAIFADENFSGGVQIKPQKPHKNNKEAPRPKSQRAKPDAPPKQKRALTDAVVSDEAAAVYAAFDTSPVSADTLIDRCGLDGAAVLASLTELELFGYVTALPGGRYEIAD